MKYFIYQINLTREEINRVNAGEDVAKYHAQLDAMMLGNPEKGLAGDFYEKVAIIEAEDLDEVFHFSNTGVEQAIYRFGPMHSISVGDIIIDEDNNRSVVKSFGFETL